MTDSGAAVVALGLSKSYRGGLFSRRPVEVVSDVSFSVGAGEALGLVGANGSGKTTTLGLLLGLVRPTRGQSRLLGREPADSAVRRSLGFLPESGGVEPLSTPLETLRLRAELQGLDRSLARDAIERFGLAGVADRQLRRCSQGTVRRTALAQAALGEPKILVLDEPSSGLDAGAARLLEEIVAEARARGACVVLTSHVAAAGVDLCDRVVVLEAGRVVLSGTRAELLDEEGVIEARVRGLDGAALSAVVSAAGGRVESVRSARRDVAFLLEAARRAGRASASASPRRPSH